MITDSEFAAKVYGVAEQARVSVWASEQTISEYEDMLGQLKDGSGEAVRYTELIKAERAKQDEAIAGANRSLEEMLNARVAELDASMALDASKMTEDAELLRMPGLNARDLNHIRDRAGADNLTMSRLCDAYASEHEVSGYEPASHYEVARAEAGKRVAENTVSNAVHFLDKWARDGQGERVLKRYFHIPVPMADSHW